LSSRNRNSIKLKTKERILEATATLLAENGYANLSTYKIADSLGISQGNLRYHYANQAEIVTLLFDNYMKKYQAIIDQLLVNLKNIVLSDLLDTYKSIHELNYEHAYIFVDLTGIAREIPYVKDQLQKTYLQRRGELMLVMNTLISKGFILQQPNDYIYRKLIYLQIFISDFWMPHSKIYFDEDLKSEVKFYNEHWILLIEPYLTKKGYLSIMKYVNTNPEIVFDEFKEHIQTKAAQH